MKIEPTQAVYGAKKEGVKEEKPEVLGLGKKDPSLDPMADALRARGIPVTDRRDMR